MLTLRVKPSKEGGINQVRPGRMMGALMAVVAQHHQIFRPVSVARPGATVDLHPVVYLQVAHLGVMVLVFLCNSALLAKPPLYLQGSGACRTPVILLILTQATDSVAIPGFGPRKLRPAPFAVGGTVPFVVPVTDGQITAHNFAIHG